MSLKYEGWRELEDSRERQSWERARIIAYYSASANLKKGTKIGDLFTHPYEEKKPSRRRFKKAPKGSEILKLLKEREGLVYEPVKSEKDLKINGGR